MTLDVEGVRGPPSLVLPRSAPDLTSNTLGEPLSTSPSPKSRKSVMIRASRSPTSSHHSRSQSVRTVKRPNRLELPGEFRSRVSSMPLESTRYNPRLLLDEDVFYRLRNFTITSKGIVNRGDSLRSRRSRSNNSVASIGSRYSERDASNNSRDSTAANSFVSSQEGDAHSRNLQYRVVMLGAPGVGKTALTTQFMTSEYMNAYDSSLDDDYGEKTVSVLLDGEESEMLFIDHPSHEMSVENCITTYEPHAYVVVYSITDKTSFHVAEDILGYLWKGNYMRNKAVILVGNKTDLVRARTITSDDGKSLATAHDSKFIETSSGINHNVDELLVGILSQIRLKLKRAVDENGSNTKKKEKKAKYRGTSRTVSLRAKGLIQKLCKRDSKSKSCENLHEL